MCGYSTAGDYVESLNNSPDSDEAFWYDEKSDSPPPGNDVESSVTPLYFPSRENYEASGNVLNTPSKGIADWQRQPL